MRRDTRTDLLDAAQSRLAEHGYAGTSIRDLAADVGIKESSVYKHFSSKQALLEAVLARADERVAATATVLGVSVDDPDAAAATYDGIILDRLTEVAQLVVELHVGPPHADTPSVMRRTQSGRRARTDPTTRAADHPQGARGVRR